MPENQELQISDAEPQSSVFRSPDQVIFHRHNGTDSPQLFENSLVLRDVDTNNASTTKHGFMKKLSGDTTKFINGAGLESTPSQDYTLKSYTTAANANSITISGLDLLNDLQYHVVIRYANGGSTSVGTSEQRIKVNADTGSNYSYVYEQYSNSGGGTEANAAVNATTVFKLNTDISSVDGEGQIILDITGVSPGYPAWIQWSMLERDPGVTTILKSVGGGYWGGSANMTQFEIGALGGNCTKQWYVSVYTLSIT